MTSPLLAIGSASLTLILVSGTAGGSLAQQDPPRRDCCFHIYSAGSNLGWASALLKNTTVRERLDPADEPTFDMMLAAAQHVEAAYATCSKLNPAWEDCAGRAEFLRGLVNDIRQRPIPIVRSQTAFSVRSTYAWGDALRVRVFGEQKYEHATCAEKYFKLGFSLAYADQTLGIAHERLAQGRRDWTGLLSDATSSLTTAQTVLAEYAGLAGCTPIADLNLPSRIERLIHADTAQLPAMRTESNAIWQVLQRRVVAICPDTAPVPPDPGVVLGHWNVSFGGSWGGQVGTAREWVITNRGELEIVRSGGGLAGRMKVETLPWENLRDVNIKDGVLRFTRIQFYHQFFEGTLVSPNRLEGTFGPADGSARYRWWAEK